LFLARHLGALDENVVQIADYPTPSELMLSFQNSALDAITVTLDDVARLASYGHNARIIAVLTYSQGADALLGREDLPDVRSLRGKTIAFEADTLGAYLLARALDKHDVLPAEVTLRSSRADRLNRFFSMSLADAVVTYEPYRSSLIRAGAKVLFDSAEIPGEVVNVLVTRAELLPQNLPALRHLVAAWNRGVEYLKASPRAAAEVVARRERSTTELFVASLRLLRFAGVDESRRALARDGGELAKVLQKTAGFMLAQNLLPKAVDTSPLIDDRATRPE
jgi:NitT/TauT family transport system substrate-binding protein